MASIIHAKKVKGEIETIKYLISFCLNDLKIEKRKLKIFL